MNNEQYTFTATIAKIKQDIEQKEKYLQEAKPTNQQESEVYNFVKGELVGLRRGLLYIMYLEETYR